ncbi:MAG TPA: hypothetical protein VHO26_11895 [Propionibacteriaceae bacterium]|nr:hypothetical protein [Propionibacteriaceae bacterium]
MTGTRAATALPRAVVLALLTAVALLGWQPPAAHAEDAASCQSSGGVYEYISPGGGGCSHAGGSGMTVLRSLTSVTTNSTGMICQIGGYPSTCPDPVPADDYWAYWVWSGSSWTYASVGAASDYPNPGDVRAWTFGNGVRPTWTPPPRAVAAPTTSTAAPTRTATTARTTTSATKTTATTRPTGAASVTSSTSTASRTASATTTRATSTASRTPGRPVSRATTPAPSPRASSARATTAPPTPSHTVTPVAISASPTSSSTHGTPWGAVVAGCLVLAGAGGIVVARRRTGH